MLKRAVVLVVVTAAAVAMVAMPVFAVCPLTPDEELRSYTDIIFDGVALEGPTNQHGQLISPAQFQVAEYVKGTGPTIILVETFVETATGPVGQEDFWAPRPGESWRIYGFTEPEEEALVTTICSGTHRIGALSLAGATPTPTPPKAAETEGVDRRTSDHAAQWLVMTGVVVVGGAVGSGAPPLGVERPPRERRVVTATAWWACWRGSTG